MENTAPTNRRKYFKVLDPVIQKDIYRWLAVMWICWVGAQAFFIFYIQWLGENIEFYDTKTVMMILFFIFSSILFLFTLIGTNYFISRCLGPIYRIRQDLEESQQSGKHVEIKLRDDDYFQDIADKLNQMQFKNEK